MQKNQWLFKKKHLKANPGKSHILLWTKEPVPIDGIPLAASFYEKLLGVTIDSELKFENHIAKLCPKISKKLNALCCISSIYRITIQLSVDMDASF